MSRADPALARVFLFTPGNRPERFAKAAASGADALILDLEDAVSAADKDRARGILAAHFSGDFHARLAPGQSCGLRVNNLHTPAGVRDLQALVDSGIAPDFIVLPKVESAFEVRLYARLLGERQADVGFVCAIESARGLEGAFEIAGADARVRGLAFGGVDLALDLRAALAWEPLLAARSRLIQAAAAFRVGAADVPYLALEDEAGLRAETERIRMLGFTAKLAIHPRQVAPILELFTPSALEVARAEAMVAAFRAAAGNAVEFEGRMLDEPVVRVAEQVLARAGRGQRISRE